MLGSEYTDSLLLSTQPLMATRLLVLAAACLRPAGSWAARAAAATVAGRCAARPSMLAPLPSSSAAPNKEDDGNEPCNVVLTHTNADFDSLAGTAAPRTATIPCQS